MLKSNPSNKSNNILKPLAYGVTAFTIAGLLACVIVLNIDNYILALTAAGGVGGTLLGLFLKMRNKVIRMAVSGIIGLPLGLMLSFLLVEGIGSLIPTMGHYLENTIIPDVTAILLLGIIYGGIFGGLVFGRKAVKIYIVACGALSLPSGLMVGALNESNTIQDRLAQAVPFLGNMDLNLLSIFIGLGFGIGLGTGLVQKSLWAQTPQEK